MLRINNQQLVYTQQKINRTNHGGLDFAQPPNRKIRIILTILKMGIYNPLEVRSFL